MLVSTLDAVDIVAASVVQYSAARRTCQMRVSTLFADMGSLIP